MVLQVQSHSFHRWTGLQLEGEPQCPEHPSDVLSSLGALRMWLHFWACSAIVPKEVISQRPQVAVLNKLVDRKQTPPK